MTGEKELMAIVFAMVHFKVNLYGREFIVRTDHRPLQWLKKLASPSTRLARWLQIVRQTQTAKEVVKVMFNLVYRHCCPKSILTDQGKCFEAELFQELLALQDIAKSRKSPYHPQADGLTERFNQGALEGMLLWFNEKSLPDWDKYLDPLSFACNTAIHATTRVTPFEMAYDRKSRMPLGLIFSTQVQFQVELEPEDFALEKKSLEKSVWVCFVVSRRKHSASEARMAICFCVELFKRQIQRIFLNALFCVVF